MNQTSDKVSHTSFKQKGHEIILNYLYEFKSQKIG